MTDGPKAVQEEQADDGVVRALSVAKTVLDAGRAGITRGELRERVESYIELRASGQDDDSFERMFGRDKEYLRATGVPLTEISSAGDYRYSIDPDQYGLPDLRLEPAERLVLRQAHAVFAESNIRGLQHALWALIPEADPQDDVALSAPPCRFRHRSALSRRSTVSWSSPRSAWVGR
ncbi:hypothetical protein [Nesterenkonia sp. NBAIMH1]|uniref:hypothetical protein n=1 Tax=Nesterenkonia sp. NBAIMH1 TaxID=2600320 RepID=UPI0011B39639|nr:hypothetical protein [Nesterenkonia sp. NBAIMH1]